MHKIALFFPKTAAFHGLRFETKKSITLNKRQKTRLFDILRIATNFSFSSIRQLSGGLRPNLARILYLITKCDILLTSLLFCFFIIATIQNMIAFQRAGDGIAWALCTSLINFISLQTFPFRSLTAQRRLRPNLAHILYLITKFDILTSLLFCFL